MLTENIFSAIPESLPEEITRQIAHNSDIRIERILSHGHRSPESFWYDQTQDEWVILLAGAARLQFADQPEELTLTVGDHLLIPAHRKHRVSWTSPETTTIWLAIFSSQPLLT